MTINGKLYSNILLVFALESEAGKEFESFNKLPRGRAPKY